MKTLPLLLTITIALTACTAPALAFQWDPQVEPQSDPWANTQSVLEDNEAARTWKRVEEERRNWQLQRELNELQRDRMRIPARIY